MGVSIYFFLNGEHNFLGFVAACCTLSKSFIRWQLFKTIFIHTVFLDSKDDDKEEKELPCLDRFLAKNTSEDNASFEHIMEMAEDKEKLRHSWLYEAEAEFKEVWMCGVEMI